METLLVELEKLEEALEGEEREDTWERFERGLLRFAAVTRGGGYRFGAVFVEGMGVKGLGGRVVECVSLRRVSPRAKRESSRSEASIKPSGRSEKTIFERSYVQCGRKERLTLECVAGRVRDQPRRKQ